MENNSVVVMKSEQQQRTLVIEGYTPTEVDIIRSQIAVGCSDGELQLFGKICQNKRLDPFSKQIYALKRKSWDADAGAYVEKMSIQTAIDGFRIIASRTGLYDGQLGPFWCGPDGVWKEVWLSPEPPMASRVGALRRNCKEPFWGTAIFTSYVQLKRDGKPTSMWAKMPDLMIAKCAESLALRKAFPEELSGIYTTDEMGSQDNDKSAEPKNANQHVTLPSPIKQVTIVPVTTDATRSKLIKEMIDAVALSNISTTAVKGILEHGFGVKEARELDNEGIHKFIDLVRNYKPEVSTPPVPPINNGQPFDPNFDDES